MKPVYQTVVDKGHGNCMQAAIASLLELQLDEVPNFIKYKEPNEWHMVFMNFMEIQGYEHDGTIGTASTKKETYEDLLEEVKINGCLYGSVKSRSFEGVSHAVLLDEKGIVVHDPHPQKKHLGVDVVASGELNYWHSFLKIEVPKCDS